MWKSLLVTLVLVQSASASPRTSGETPRPSATKPARGAARRVALPPKRAAGDWEQNPTHEVATDCFSNRWIRRTFKQHREQLERCYSRETQFGGGPEGTVTLHFTIEADGRVTHASAESDLYPSIKDCVVAELRSWKFPVSGEPARVNYPLHFQLPPSAHR